MQQACQESDVQVKEFTVAPKIDPEEGLPIMSGLSNLKILPKIQRFGPKT